MSADKIKSDETNKTSVSFLLMALLILLCYGAIGTGLYSVYTYIPHQDNNDIHSYYAGFGDFMGGIMNPFLTFITVLFLLYTIIQNRKIININSNELKNSTEELAKANQAILLNSKNNMLKLDLEIIDMATKQFQEMISIEDIYDQHTNKHSLRSCIESFYSQRHFIVPSEDIIRVVFDANDRAGIANLIYMAMIDQATLFANSISEVVSERPHLSTYYRHHIISRTIISLHSLGEPVIDNNNDRFREMSKVHTLLEPILRLNKKPKKTTTTHQPQS